MPLVHFLNEGKDRNFGGPFSPRLKQTECSVRREKCEKVTVAVVYICVTGINDFKVQVPGLHLYSTDGRNTQSYCHSPMKVQIRFIQIYIFSTKDGCHFSSHTVPLELLLRQEIVFQRSKFCAILLYYD